MILPVVLGRILFAPSSAPLVLRRLRRGQKDFILVISRKNRRLRSFLPFYLLSWKNSQRFSFSWVEWIKSRIQKLRNKHSEIRNNHESASFRILILLAFGFSQPAKSAAFKNRNSNSQNNTLLVCRWLSRVKSSLNIVPRVFENLVLFSSYCFLVSLLIEYSSSLARPNSN